MSVLSSVTQWTEEARLNSLCSVPAKIPSWLFVDMLSTSECHKTGYANTSSLHNYNFNSISSKQNMELVQNVFSHQNISALAVKSAYFFTLLWNLTWGRKYLILIGHPFFVKVELLWPFFFFFANTPCLPYNLVLTNCEYSFGCGFLKNALLSGYSNVSQASSFHWLGPGGLLVIQGPGLQSHAGYVVLFISRHIM